MAPLSNRRQARPIGRLSSSYATTVSSTDSGSSTSDVKRCFEAGSEA